MHTTRITAATALVLLTGLAAAGVAATYGTVTGAADVAPTDHLIGWYQFQGSGSTAADSSSHANDGALVDAARVTEGVFLDGNTSHVALPQLLAGKTAFTVMYWADLAADSYTRDERVFSSGGIGADQVLVWPNTGDGADGLSFLLWDGSAAARLDTGETRTGWTHVAATWDGTTMTMYADGTPIGSRSFTGDGTVGDPGGPMFLGQSANTATNRFAGTVGDARIYDIALDAEDVALVHDQTCTGFGGCN